MNNSMSSGYLEIFIGPMWSGKTSELVKLHKRYSFCNVPVLAINYFHDTTASSVTTITNHDQLNIPCESGETLSGISDIMNKKVSKTFDDANVILINEGQFFKDIVGWVKCAVETYNKTVYVCGLDGDYQRKTFGDWLYLIPFCDKVTKLHSLCGSCKREDAIFSHRNSGESNAQELIGTMYTPLWRKCYISLNT